MMFELDINRQTITIEGITYKADDFKFSKELNFATQSEFHKELYDFLKDWYSSSNTIEVKTSGSTGVPKKMQVEKYRMMQSAVLTCSFLNLKNNNKALLCLPLQYIAGKMVVVRSLVCGLDLYPVAPNGHPLKLTSITFDFAAMVPLQVIDSLSVPAERQKLSAIRNLIIGGAAIDKQLASDIKNFPNNIYSTYGMTETLSHIALRKLNGSDASDNYVLFEDVAISLSEDGTLVIDAPKVSPERLYTNDVVQINEDGSFKVLGRKDNVINTGGIKVQIEEVEAILKTYIPNINFAITSLPDSKFGEQIIIVTEELIDMTVFKNVQPFYIVPKKVFKIEKIPLTETSKIDRPKLKKIILENIF